MWPGPNLPVGIGLLGSHRGSGLLAPITYGDTLKVIVQVGVAGAIAGFFTVSRVWGNVPGGMVFDFVNKNNLL